MTSGRVCEELHAERLGSRKVDIPESQPRVSIAMALWQTTDAVYALFVVEPRARGNRQSIASPDRCACSRVDGQGQVVKQVRCNCGGIAGTARRLIGWPGIWNGSPYHRPVLLILVPL